MLAAHRNNKATGRAKALGLSVNTKSASASAHGTKPLAVQGDSSQKTLVASHSPSSLKACEALLNPDWRGNRRTAPSLQMPPVTAAWDQTEFQKAGGKQVKQLTIDTSVVNQYGPRRYRDTPVDPDFIHSAPVTKTTFGIAEESTLSDVEESPDSSDYIQYINDTAFEKSLVELDSLTPATRESFEKQLNWQKPAASQSIDKEDQWYDDWNCRAPLSAIPYTSNARGLRDTEFPTASVHSFSNERRLSRHGWDDLDRHVTKNLALLEAPRTAGLPVDRLRKDYEKSQQAVAMKPVVEDPAVQYMETGGRSQGNQFPLKLEQESQERQASFEALINKLQRSSKLRLGANPAVDIKQSSIPKKSKKHEPDSSSQSSDSSGGGVRLKGTLLNPKATEFKCTSNKLVSADRQSQTSHVQESCSEVSPVESQADGSSMTITSKDVRDLFGFIRGLKEQIVNLEQASQESSIQLKQLQHLQTLASQYNLNPNMYQGPSAPGYGYGAQSGLQSGVQPNGGYMPPQPYQAPVTMPSQPYQVPVTGPSQDYPNAPSSMAMVAAGYYYPPPNNSGFNGRAPYTSMPSTNGPQNFQPATQGQQSQAMQLYRQPGPVTKATQPNDLPLHVKAQMVYGPKPARKPKGLPSPGDFKWTRQQQDYELYLEQKRATNIGYAMKCRERQAKRANRRRLPAPEASDNSTGAPWGRQITY
ncbi:uncharacterized protein F4822DRAFT_443059 [Hypoxylon trugodes]|uniref:uncharacterized protein n=1 Tax=Hypoxylon trugodes TaxID=326681 RepID=UPI002198C010|nr:uncharacterized protein F4822DRAFT_443059 [Hypoxylon trugodes]KAI1390048.1 hypothetical protein F4822DRAFT_443059 [Hypoxylon trugodes]